MPYVLVAFIGLAAGVGLDWICDHLGRPWPGQRLPGRRFGLAVITAALLVASAWQHGRSVRFAWDAVFVLYLLAVIVIDGERRVIPDRLNMAGTALGLALLLFWQPIAWKSALLGAFITAGFLHLGAILTRGGIGGGDLKFSPAFGLFLGFPHAVFSLFIGLIIAATVGLIRTACRPASWREPFAFGPALACGALTGIYSGDILLALYLAT